MSVPLVRVFPTPARQRPPAFHWSAYTPTRPERVFRFLSPRWFLPWHTLAFPLSNASRRSHGLGVFLRESVPKPVRLTKRSSELPPHVMPAACLADSAAAVTPCSGSRSPW